ncbi:MAG: LicD family protein [Eubacterium sp.]|nr:LicD family protein [Eubacterium sp.]
MANNKEQIKNDNKPNAEAMKVIEESVKRAVKYKGKAVSEFITIINDICRKDGLRYFAMGRLLTWCIYGEDTWPESNQYYIAMMRRDYDLFIKRLQKEGKELGIRLTLPYALTGHIHRLNTTIVKKFIYKDKSGKLEYDIQIRIEPYDFLPDDEVERQSFMKRVADATRAYRALSMRYIDYRNNQGPGMADKLKTLSLLPTIILPLRTQKRKYEQLLRTYSRQGESSIAGRVEILNYPAHSWEEISPITDKDFLGTKLMVPAFPDEFMPLPREEEDKKAAEGRFETLRVFDALCREHGLTYVAMEDLALACAHHDDNWEGLITQQWYVGMLRRDYEQVMSLLYDPEKNKGLLVKDAVNEFPFIRDHMAGVVKEEYIKKIPGELYYMLYILPLDAVPEDYEVSRTLLSQVTEAEETLDELILYEKGRIWDKPPKSKPDSSKQFVSNQRLRQSVEVKGGMPEELYTYIVDKVERFPSGELYPVQDCSFHGFSVMCPANAFFWHNIKDEEYTEYIAGEKTKVLARLDQLCQDQELPYFAIAKLLTGAMIYHDAMPESGDSMWDVGLIRTDYERLLEFLRQSGSDYGLELHESLDKEGKYPLPTCYVTDIGRKYSSILIRILPFDKFPEDFYLMQGFQSELDEKNTAYQALIDRYETGATAASVAAAAKITDEAEIARLQEYVDTAVPAEEARKINDLARMFNDDERTHTYKRVAFDKSRAVQERDLFPVQRVPFRDIMISCPRDTSIWQPVLDADLERQVSKIQEADLLLIDEFDRVCKELGVGYFICGGTMLGYMRHGGFIPWDDDVDCAMLREDYDRFINEAGPLLKERFFLQTRETDPNIPYLFSKIRLDDTEYITEYNEHRDFHKGICLDIFPFDYLPNDLEERRAFVEEIRALARAHHLIARKQYPVSDDPVKPRNAKEEQYIREQSKLLKEAWSKDLKVSQQAYLDVATRYNDQVKKLGLHVVGSFVPTYTWIDLNNLLPYQRGDFEGHSVSVPKRPDIFLEMQYHDYMELPPKHNQVAHRLERWATWDDHGSRHPEEDK